MRSSRFAGLFAVVASAVLCSEALAADLDAELAMDVPELDTIEIATGWYVRGDLGYAPDIGLGSSYQTLNGATPVWNDSANSLDSRLNVAFGVGYTFTDMLRADVTLNRVAAAFAGRGACDSSLPGDCERRVSADLAGYGLLANGYVDLGTVMGFTPYVGAGLGYTYLEWDDVESRNLCGGAACGGNPGESYPGVSDWRFTYALMAGVAYDITSRLKLDAGYRYLRIKGGDMYGWSATNASAGATGPEAYHDDLEAHEIRVGLRFSF